MRTLAIASGKGGVGKTSLAANLGLALARYGRPCVLFDADLALANLDLLLGVRPEFNLQHVLAEEKTLAEIVQPGPEGVGLIAGGSGVGMLMQSGPKRLAKFFEGLEALSAETDTLIFDTGAGLDTRVMAFARAADEVMVVATPDPASLTDAYAFVKVLTRRQPEVRLGLTFNCVQDEAQGRALFEKLQAVCHRFLDKDLEYLGSVREDPHAVRAARERRPLLLSAPRSDAAQDIVRLAGRLMQLSRSPMPRVPLRVAS